MKKFKSLCLVCFSLLLILSSCSSVLFENVSASHNKGLVDAKDSLKFELILKRVKESVVILSISSLVNPESDPTQGGLCAGVVVDNIGHIITNFHCIYNQNYIRLYYYDKNDWENYEVNVIGLDPLADLALLEVIGKEKPIPYINFADDTENIVEGTEVFALGHPMGMAWTLTKGIISSNERYSRHPYIKALQTDAAINPGNSGGPLLNMRGEIIGINTLIISKVKENAGVGLAIRGDIVKKSFESMLDNGRVDRPAVGIMIMGLRSERNRKKVLKEFPDIKPDHIPNTLGLWVRPTDDIPEGLKAHDTIIGVNDVMINDGLQFSDQLIKYKIGDTITLTIIRKRKYMKVDVPLKVFPVPVERIYQTKSQVVPLPSPE